MDVEEEVKIKMNKHINEFMDNLINNTGIDKNRYDYKGYKESQNIF